MFEDALLGCLVGGAIGDGIGSAYEGPGPVSIVDFEIPWLITDDTQLTIATCEAILDAGAGALAGSGTVLPEKIAAHLLQWYAAGWLRGLGASTLKALRDLQMGAHWWLAGRSGEFAAGNGAAMRIAPLSFLISPDEDRGLIREAAEMVGSGGHVVQSVPFAVFAAGKLGASSFSEILREIICCGGDTDTNASIAGQIELSDRLIKFKG